MKTSVVCGDHEALIAYLYGEGDPDQRQAVSRHVAICPRCSEELLALDVTRDQLSAWLPPEVPLGFRVVLSQPDASSKAASGHLLRPKRWWGQPLPTWAQAAAAVVIFGLGASLGALRGVTMGPGTAAARVESPAKPSAAIAVSAADLSALEHRLHSEIAQVQAVRSTAPASSPELLERVRTMINESEQRQQKELAMRTAEVVRDFDAQRRVDLTRIERTLGQMDGTTGVEVEQQRQMLNYLMRVSQRGQ